MLSIPRLKCSRWWEVIIIWRCLDGRCYALVQDAYWCGVMIIWALTSPAGHKVALLVRPWSPAPGESGLAGASIVASRLSESCRYGFPLEFNTQRYFSGSLPIKQMMKQAMLVMVIVLTRLSPQVSMTKLRNSRQHSSAKLERLESRCQGGDRWTVRHLWFGRERGDSHHRWEHAMIEYSLCVFLLT